MEIPWFPPLYSHSGASKVDNQNLSTLKRKENGFDGIDYKAHVYSVGEHSNSA